MAEGGEAGGARSGIIVFTLWYIAIAYSYIMDSSVFGDKEGRDNEDTKKEDKQKSPPKEESEVIVIKKPASVPSVKTTGSMDEKVVLDADETEASEGAPSEPE